MEGEKKELIGTTGNNGDGQEQKGFFKKGADMAVRGWNRFSTSKGGRWAIRCLKGAAIGFGLYEAYNAGKKSVKPTMIMVDPVKEEEQPETTEEPTEVEDTNTETE